MRYQLIDSKDPVIHTLRWIIEIDASHAGISFGAMLHQIERGCGVKARTMGKWFAKGGTVSPLFQNVARVACYMTDQPISLGDHVVGKRRYPSIRVVSRRAA